MIKREKKQIVLKILAVFFCLMLAFTVISRTVSSFIVPEVTIEHPDRGTLTMKAEGTARVLSQGEKAVTPQAGLKIKETVQEGETVKKGDLLFSYDMESLAEELDQKKGELRKIQLQIQQQELQGQADARTSPLESASRALEEAQSALEDQEAYCRQLEEAYQEQLALEADQDLQSEEEEQQEMPERESQKLESQLEQEWEKRNSLVESYNQAADAYEVAEIEEENARKNEEKNSKLSLLQQQVLKIDAKEKEKEIKKLEELVQSQGKVTSPEDAVVIQNPLEGGATVTGQEILKISYGNFVVQGSLSQEDFGKVKEKDQVVLTSPGQEKGVTAEISQIKSKPSEQSGQEGQETGADSLAGYFLAEIPFNTFAYGTQISYKIEKESEAVYEKRIPLSAVREDTGGTYCLVLQKESTVLGEVQTAQKISVKIKEKDDTYAAIDSSVGMEDQVITGSTKNIADGDRVRIGK